MPSFKTKFIISYSLAGLVVLALSLYFHGIFVNKNLYKIDRAWKKN
ncbi:MAG: hypothetical protein KKH91_00555 [Elusimicrobia bacterium]|nr:hypothetical protein [Elusimicrobiota bacterium]